MSADEIRDVDFKCAGCGADVMGRVTDKALESWGWRKINGGWHCNFCTGAGYAGLYRRDSEGAGQDKGEP